MSTPGTSSPEILLRLVVRRCGKSGGGIRYQSPFNKSGNSVLELFNISPDKLSCINFQPANIIFLDLTSQCENARVQICKNE